MSKKRSYAPTTDELNEAIEDFLHENPKATNEQVRTALNKQHVTWVIPDRRLKKFVKRQKSGKPMTAADDSTLTGGGKLKNLFTFGSGSAAAKKEEKKKIVPKTSTAKPAIVKKVDKEAAPVKEVAKPEPAPPVVEEKALAVPDAVAFADDNDGTKENTCAVCEGCLIL